MKILLQVVIDVGDIAYSDRPKICRTAAKSIEQVLQATMQEPIEVYYMGKSDTKPKPAKFEGLISDDNSNSPSNDSWLGI